MGFYRLASPESPDAEYLIDLEHIIALSIREIPRDTGTYSLVITLTNGEKTLTFTTKEEAARAYSGLSRRFAVVNDGIDQEISKL